MSNLRQVAGEFAPDSLIPNTSFPQQVGGVTLAGGQGLLLRGTVVGAKDDNLHYLTDTATTVTADAILTDDVDTGGEDAPAVTTTAYVSGVFNRAALIFGGEDTAEDHEETLRTKGIYLKAVL